MGFFFRGVSRVWKAKKPSKKATLGKLKSFLDAEEPQAVQWLMNTWDQQQASITYKELREALLNGYISEKQLTNWQQDYTTLVNTKLRPQWEQAMVVAAQDYTQQYPYFVYNPAVGAAQEWLHTHGAELVTNSVQAQIDALNVVIQRATHYDAMTPDSLSRIMRPIIGLTVPQTKAYLNYHSEVLHAIQSANPHMSLAAVEKKAQDAALRYGARQHRYRAMVIARTELAFAYNAGAYGATKEAQEKGYIGDCKKTWLTAADERVCEICGGIDGEEVNMDAEFSIGVLLPPAHPHCYHKDVQVMTDQGLLHFWELDGTELFWSIDPETLIPEYVKAKQRIQYRYTGELLHFHQQRGIDITVTPEHRMLIKQTRNEEWQLLQANSEFCSEAKMLKSCAWHGEQPPACIFGIEIETFTKFMAYWLSDGSAIRRGNHVQISIANTRRWEQIMDDLAEMKPTGKPGKIYVSRNRELGDYLLQFGTCSEKFIPDIIKNAPVRYIELFLNAYLLCDGHTKKNRDLDGYDCGYSRLFFTTSPRLRDGLVELIMKVGGSASFKKGFDADTPVFGGRYRTNYNLWIVSWNVSRHALLSRTQIDRIPYDDMVYCVELEKNSTLLVEQKGKLVWSGNCRCVVAYEEVAPSLTVQPESSIISSEEEENLNSGEINLGTAQDADEAYVATQQYASKVTYSDDVTNIDSLNELNGSLEYLTSKYGGNKLVDISIIKNSKSLASGNYAQITIRSGFLNDPAGTVADSTVNWVTNNTVHLDRIKTDLEAAFQRLASSSSVIERIYIQNAIDEAQKEIAIYTERLRFVRRNVIYPGQEVRSVITHEYAHVLADQLFGQFNGKLANPLYERVSSNPLFQKSQLVIRTFMTAKRNGDIYSISVYASESAKEFLAEVFTIYDLGMETLPQYISDMIEEVLNI